MKTVRKVLLICLISVISMLFYSLGNKVYAYAYYEIDVKLGYDNQAKYGRYIPIEIDVYSDSVFEGTVSVQRNTANGISYIETYPVTLKEYDIQTIQLWVPLFEGGEEFTFILKNQAGEEVKQVSKSVEVLDSDYTELFVGVIDENGMAKKLFDKVNLGEYTNTAFPYILTRTFDLSPSQITGDVEYTLNCFDIIIIMDNAMFSLDDDNVECLLEWVKDGHTLIMEYADNINNAFADIYKNAYENREEDDELSPGLWMLEMKCGEGNIGIFDSHLGGSNLYSFAGSNQKHIGMAIGKVCTLEQINSIIDYDMHYANYDDSYDVRYMLNSAIGKPVPRILNYILVIVLYIMLVGPVLYFLLHKKRRVSYMFLVVVFAGVFSYGVYKMGQNTRFTDLFLQYANIVNITDEKVEEDIYICANVPYKDTYYMKVPAGYTIMPLWELQSNDLNDLQAEETEEYIEVVHSEDANNKKIILHNDVPFSREYLEARRSYENTGDWQIDADITYYDNVVSGEIVNNSDKNYSQAAIIMYGKIMLFGEIKSGETVSVDKAKIITLPYYPNDVAKKITGLSALADNAQGGAGTTALYDELNGKAGMLEYVIGKYFDEKNTDAVLIGFTNNRKAAFQFDDRYETFGFTMIYKELDINTSIGDLKYEPLHYTAVKNVDNNNTYDAYSNTTYGSGLRLEYSFRNIDSISRIIFDNDNRNDEDNYYGIFEGITYFYNFLTLTYDKVDISKGYFYISDLENYLQKNSDGCYTLIAQYTIKTTGQYRYSEIKLPDVAVIRRNFYVENTEP